MLSRVQSHDLATTEPMTFGMHLVLDLDGCVPTLIASRGHIANYAHHIVKKIEMTAYGPPILEHFGHDDPITAGWTLVQLIETSSITGHFSEHLQSAHIDIFSCRRFSTDRAISYSAAFFEATGATYTVIVR
jgi:S-adenosylmethionine decarboxylase